MVLKPVRPVRPVKPNRYLKIASAKNPTNDFIELNDFKGFLCTGFQSLGISRKFDFLTIKNRQFVVDNKPSFKKYSLTIEILTKYSEYEQKYRELITFLDRNKKCGFRLYFKPYEGMEERYCLCSIESSSKIEKMQPVQIVLVQESMWFGAEKKAAFSNKIAYNENLFSFSAKKKNGYHSASFGLDENIENYYCVSFFNNVSTEALITNNSYNEIPLKIKVYGPCNTPIISLFKKGESVPVKSATFYVNLQENTYLEINSKVFENSVKYVNHRGVEFDYSNSVSAESSPYFYVDNGEYVITISSSIEDAFEADIIYQEEYSE